jgi:hypothetical protein
MGSWSTHRRLKNKNNIFRKVIQMKKLLLSALVSLVLFLPSAAESAEPKKPHRKTGPELATVCEDHMNKIKDTGSSLPPEWKAEFDYHLEIATIEIKALRNPNHKNHYKHSPSCHRHVKAAERIVKKSEEYAKKAATQTTELDHGKAELEKKS